MSKDNSYILAFLIIPQPLWRLSEAIHPKGVGLPYGSASQAGSVPVKQDCKV